MEALQMPTRYQTGSRTVLDACPSDMFPTIKALIQAIVTIKLKLIYCLKTLSTVIHIITGMKASVITDRLNSPPLLLFGR